MNHTLIFENIPSLISLIFLALAIISLWIKNKPFVLGILLTWYLIFGIIGKNVTFLALPFLALFFISFYGYARNKNIWLKAIGGFIFFVLTILALLHKTPGINNWLILNQHQFSPDSIPYSLYLNYETPLIGICILVFSLPLIKSIKDLITVFKIILPLSLATIIVLITGSYLLGYIHFDPKFTNIFFIWAIHNLLFTCITEEGFFRGFIQNLLCKWFSKIKYGKYLGLIIAATLFGIAHFAGGPKYIILASIAGLFYGYTYLKTERIEASILVHFFLNTTHFIFFSYPALIAAL